MIKFSKILIILTSIVTGTLKESYETIGHYTAHKLGYRYTNER